MQIELRALYANGIKTSLSSWAINSLGGLHVKAAPKEDASLRVDFDLPFDAGVFAFAIARKIYLWFGIDEDKVPYTSERDGIRFVDADKLAKV